MVNKANTYLDSTVYNVIKSKLNDLARTSFADFSFSFTAKLNLNKAFVSYSARFNKKDYTGTFVLYDAADIWRQLIPGFKQIVMKEYIQILKVAQEAKQVLEDAAKIARDDLLLQIDECERIYKSSKAALDNTIAQYSNALNEVSSASTARKAAARIMSIASKKLNSLQSIIVPSVNN